VATQSDMTRGYSVGLAAVMLAGCVTTAQFKDQVARTNAAQGRAQVPPRQKDLADAQKGIADQEGLIDGGREQLVALQAKIKAGEDQLLAMQKSNKDLTDTMDAFPAA